MPEIAAILPQAPGGVDTFLSIYNARRQQRAQSMADAEKQKLEREKQLAAENEKARKGADDNYKAFQGMVNSPALLPDDVRVRQMVDGKILDLSKRAAEEIYAKNGTMSTAEIYNRFQPEVLKLKKYKDNETAFKQIKDVLLAKYDKIPGFNKGEAERILQQGFFGDGDIDKMAADETLLSGMLDANMDQIITSDEGIAAWAGKQGIADKSKTVSRKGPKGSTTENVAYKMPSFMEIGDDGMPMLPAETIPLENLAPQQSNSFQGKAYGNYRGMAQQEESKMQGISNKAQAYIGTALANENGQVKLAEQETFRNMMEDGATKTRIVAMATAFKKSYEKETGEKFEGGPITDELLMRGLAYRKLEQYKKEAVRLGDTKTVNNNFINTGSGRNKPTAAEINKSKAANDYTKGVSIAITHKGIPAAYLKRAKPLDVEINGLPESRNLTDITPLFGRGKFNAGKGNSGRVFVEPNNEGTIYVQAGPDQPIEAMTGQEANAFFEVMINANLVDEVGDVPSAQDEADLAAVLAAEKAKREKEAAAKNKPAEAPGFFDGIKKGVKSFFGFD